MYTPYFVFKSESNGHFTLDSSNNLVLFSSLSNPPFSLIKSKGFNTDKFNKLTSKNISSYLTSYSDLKLLVCYDKTTGSVSKKEYEKLSSGKENASVKVESIYLGDSIEQIKFRW